MSPPDPPALGRVAGSALSWSLVNSVLSKFATVGIGVILARLLGPEEFGSFAVATVALLAVLSFNELGISLAIVRWPGDPDAIVPTVTTLSVVSSGILFAASYAAAPYFSAAMGDAGSTGVVRWMCVCILINGIVAAPAAVMQRRFMQRRRMLIDQVNIWLGAAVSVALAISGMGAMSLAIGRVSATVVSGILFVALAPGHVRFGFDAAVAPALLRFGLPLAGASAVVFAAGYADQVIVGAALGSTALGFYVLAFNLASWPVTVLSQPLRAVAPALFARMQGDRAAMARTFLTLAILLASVAVPLCAAVSAAAEPIIGFVYGEQWLPSAEVLRWLALLAILRILFELAYDYLVVLKRSASVLWIQVIWLVALIPALVFAASRSGLGGVALAQLLIAALIVSALYARRLGRDDIDLRSLAVGLAGPIVVGSVTWAAVTVAVMVTSSFGGLLGCLVAGAFGLAGASILLYRNRSMITKIRDAREVPAGAA